MFQILISENFKLPFEMFEKNDVFNSFSLVIITMKNKNFVCRTAQLK